MTNQTQETFQNELNDIEEYYRKNRFINLFLKTNKIKDLIWSKEAFLSLLISVLFLMLLVFNYFEYSTLDLVISKATMDIIKLLLPITTAGLFTLLGLTIGGLAIVTGTISSEVITRLRKKKVFPHFINVIFNFYFCGAITGLSIITSLLSYVSILLGNSIYMWLFIIWVLFQSYIIIFSTLYTVMLLGTCIRIFLLRYMYTHDQ